MQSPSEPPVFPRKAARRCTIVTGRGSRRSWRGGGGPDPPSMGMVVGAPSHPTVPKGHAVCEHSTHSLAGWGDTVSAGAGPGGRPVRSQRAPRRLLTATCPGAPVTAVAGGVAPLQWPLYTAPRTAGGPGSPSGAESRRPPPGPQLGALNQRTGCGAPWKGCSRVITVQEPRTGAGAHSKASQLWSGDPGAE